MGSGAGRVRAPKHGVAAITCPSTETGSGGPSSESNDHRPADRVNSPSLPSGRAQNALRSALHFDRLGPCCGGILHVASADDAFVRLDMFASARIFLFYFITSPETGPLDLTGQATQLLNSVDV